MASTLVSAAVEGSEKAVDLPFPPAAYGLGVLGALFVLLLITYAFRSVGKRH